MEDWGLPPNLQVTVDFPALFSVTEKAMLRPRMFNHSEDLNLLTLIFSIPERWILQDCSCSLSCTASGLTIRKNGAQGPNHAQNSISRQFMGQKLKQCNPKMHGLFISWHANCFSFRIWHCWCYRDGSVGKLPGIQSSGPVFVSPAPT